MSVGKLTSQYLYRTLLLAILETHASIQRSEKYLGHWLYSMYKFRTDEEMATFFCSCLVLLKVKCYCWGTVNNFNYLHLIKLPHK